MEMRERGKIKKKKHRRIREGKEKSRGEKVQNLSSDF